MNHQAHTSVKYQSTWKL